MSDSQKFRTMDWLIGVATTIALAIGGWSMVRLISISERVAVIESTRFTDEDAREIITPQLELIVKELEHIKQDLDRIADQP